MIDPQYAERLRALHAQLKIPETYAKQVGLPMYEEPAELVATELDFYGREQRLTSGAFLAWRSMQERARSEGISLLMLSAYRSVDYQCQILRRKLDAGQSLEQILRVNAAPGFSEHHTGRAIDIGAPECPVLEERFEETTAFAWLQSNAKRFGFTMSYPRDNNCGISYEPWHWCFNP
jgi:D-alanyl-D-alanine carboxypeptidase